MHCRVVGRKESILIQTGLEIEAGQGIHRALISVSFLVSFGVVCFGKSCGEIARFMNAVATQIRRLVETRTGTNKVRAGT